METIKITLFIKTILAEDSLKNSMIREGEGMETHLKREHYENLLDLIEQSGWYEEYRSFKIMAALYFAGRKDKKQLPQTV